MHFVLSNIYSNMEMKKNERKNKRDSIVFWTLRVDLTDSSSLKTTTLIDSVSWKAQGP